MPHEAPKLSTRAYAEIPPAAHLAPFVECFWTSYTTQPDPDHTVLPDGCMDFIFTRLRGEPRKLEVVGAMTGAHRIPLPSECLTVGVRFRPGMARAFLPAPAAELTDGSFLLESVAGRMYRETADRLADARTPQQHVDALQQALRPPSCLTPVQKAVAALTRFRGQWRMDDLASQATLSPRQFRRVCLEQTGLTPKLLARILRFRAALAEAQRCPCPNWAGVAADFGYFDQSHLIRDFLQFSGRPPSQHFPQ